MVVGEGDGGGGGVAEAPELQLTELGVQAAE